MARKILQTIIDERPVDHGIRRSLSFRLGEDGASVPAILQLPPPPQRAPAVLLLHGWSSHKEQMASTLGRALLAHGIASLAIDLPLHGERSDANVLRGSFDPIALVREYRAALSEGELALRYLSAHPAVDPGRIAMAGYSLGSYITLAIAAREPVVKAVILAAGGDLPHESPFTRLLRPFADPVSAVKRLSGRPLLMVHGRHDRTIRAEQAECLFAAAGEPKEMQWWDAGHYLPEAAVAGAAAWLEDRLATMQSTQSTQSTPSNTGRAP